MKVARFSVPSQCMRGTAGGCSRSQMCPAACMISVSTARKSEKKGVRGVVEHTVRMQPHVGDMVVKGRGVKTGPNAHRRKRLRGLGSQRQG